MRAQKSFVLLLLLTLSTFALYVYQLDGQSLRGDEAFDAVFIKRPVAVLLTELRTEQPYPPLYHSALLAWTALAGDSVGLTITPAQATILVLAFSLVAFFGLFAPSQPSNRSMRLIAVSLIGIPIAGVLGLSLRRPMFDERHLVFIIAPYLALLGRGLASLGRWR